MDIKKFVSGFSPRAKMVIAASFICLAAIAMAAVFNLSNNNGWNTAQAAFTVNKSVCGTVATTCDRVGDYACSTATTGAVLYCSSDPYGRGKEWTDPKITSTGDCPKACDPSKLTSTATTTGTTTTPGAAVTSMMSPVLKMGGICVGKSDGEACVAGFPLKPLSEICGYDGTTYSYCARINAGASGGRCHVGGTKEDYCATCGEYDQDQCFCTYKKDSSSTVTDKIFTGPYEKKCGDSNTPFKNFEIYCSTGSGAAEKKACLNSTCSTGGSGCVVPPDPGCEQMNQDVVQLIEYHRNDKVTLTGQNNLDAKDGDFKTVESLLKKISDNGLSANKILFHVFVDNIAVGGSADIACASEKARDCKDDNGGQQYSCSPVGGAKTGSGCFVWSWASASGSVVSCQGRGCEITDGGNAGYCKPVSGSVTGLTCDGTGNNLGKKTEVGSYSCGGGNSTINNSYQCIEVNGKITWSDPIICGSLGCGIDGRCVGGQDCSQGRPCSTKNDQCASLCGSGWSCKAIGGTGAVSGTGHTYNINPSLGYSPYVNSGNVVGNYDGTCQNTAQGQNGCTKTGFACQGKNGFYTDTCIDSSGSSDSDSSDNSSSGSGSAYTLTYSCDQSGNCAESKVPCQYGCSKSGQNHKCAINEKDCSNPQGDDKKNEDKEKQEKEDKTAPTVSVTAPTNTVETKTADLKATTNIKSTCTYSDSVSSVSGMTMTSSDQYQHTASLTSLEKNLTNCKASHNITVTCKNAAASSNATSATGTGQTSFTVDLSKNSEYAPKVTSGMDAEKFTVANPILKAITDRPADCEYKKGSDFAIGSGTKFDTTGSYSHNAQLTGLDNNNGESYVYYVVCKDKDTCAANTPGIQIKFKVDLTGSAPTIANVTPATQNVANPTLSITTDIPATCQYKKDSTFVYGDSSATQFSNDGDYSHTVSLATYADGKYTFYVACKGKSTGTAKTLAEAIVTTISRSTTGPTISNTTAASQTTSTPTLSIVTGTAATCQFKEGADFTYGSGTQFTVDGSTAHSVVLPTLADGQHTYYVVCKDVATGEVNSSGTQIIFTIAATPMTCASLSSNDKMNDNERETTSEDDADSRYLWRSVEAGTRDKFTKVDWYAGYQFTPSGDGQVTQLCGYFGDGNTNKITLYNGSYSALATVTVSGENAWKCVNISPVSVKTDKRYYVIARVKDNPIYYEYKSGLLPRDGESATVESGIRQLASDKFGTNIKKYDYMVFGLVDVRIKLAAANTTGPEVSAPAISTSDGVISVQTNIDAICRFDRDDVDYSSMKYTFSKTSGKIHGQKICQLEAGPFTFYVKCKGATGENNASTPIQFEVTQ